MNTRGRLAAFVREQREGIRFCALFALFTGVAFAILYAGQNVLVVPLNRHLAWMTEKFIRLVFQNEPRGGIDVGKTSLRVAVVNEVLRLLHDVAEALLARWRRH